MGAAADPLTAAELVSAALPRLLPLPALLIEVLFEWEQLSPKTGKPGSPRSKAGSGAGSKRGSQSEGGVRVQAAAGTVVAPASSSVDTDGEEAGSVAEVCCFNPILYLCADRDLYQGITKAILQ